MKSSSDDNIDIKGEPGYFVNGIPHNASNADANLFSKIKQVLFDYTTRHSHDYKPVAFEYRASSIGYCSRKILLKKEPTKYLTADQVNILREEETPAEGLDHIQFGAHISGQVIHEVIQEALQQTLGSQVVGMEDEVAFTSGDGAFSMVGHYDLLLKDENDELIVIDIKSTTAKREYLPNPSHLRQLMAYQGMLKGIRGALLYVHRNTWEMTYIPQKFDKEAFSEIAIKLSRLALHEKKKTLPKIDASIFEIECKTDYYSCPFFSVCFPNYFEDDIEVVED